MCEAAVKNRKSKIKNRKSKTENRKSKTENQKQKTEKISELEFGIVPKTGTLFMAVYLSREVQQPVQLSTSAGAASYDMAKKISGK